MKIKIACPHCDGTGIHLIEHMNGVCAWCHGFGQLVQAERVCTECLPSAKDCEKCGGTHKTVRVYPAHSRFELDLLPSENYLEEN